ncbi:3-oxoacyl-[acyl-carrier protein] reductase [Nocardia transvalensis]|uniref:3-oxoacyl-[acyl-carrier protein] reductase n=1 Tax=Nocardia transvalensis TaxID=37333 RepID=A0A7W9P8T3_9NOCA|nr:SDR family oxidoreductase [Nocardia transvalensis]MBB5911308.1 3-oxoacyl-[acyl-carrier protein] reductase [Nocardia transvalensis]
MTRTIVVTGGSRGLGREVARRFAGLGERVVVTGRSERVHRTASELGVEGIECDATDPASVEDLAARLGPSVDVLVNMAGGNTDFTASAPESLKDVAAQWNANLAANLLSAVLTTTALRDRLADGGSVINVGSIGAEYAGSSYGAAKAALAAWSAGLSAQLGPNGVTVNTVSPGYIEDTDFFHGQLTDERRDHLVAATHDKRPGRPDDVADLIEFLASPQARHLTGQTLHLNGGAYTTR